MPLVHAAVLRMSLVDFCSRILFFFSSITYSYSVFFVTCSFSSFIVLVTSFSSVFFLKPANFEKKDCFANFSAVFSSCGSFFSWFVPRNSLILFSSCY